MLPDIFSPPVFRWVTTPRRSTQVNKRLWDDDDRGRRKYNPKRIAAIEAVTAAAAAAVVDQAAVAVLFLLSKVGIISTRYVNIFLRPKQRIKEGLSLSLSLSFFLETRLKTGQESSFTHFFFPLLSIALSLLQQQTRYSNKIKSKRAKFKGQFASA